MRAGAFDQSLYSEAFSRPGSDPRQWVSYGLVDKDTPDQRSVRFKDEEGNPIPEGPMVTVTLQPSGITVACRVAANLAGIQAGEWHPFLEQDEVLVVIPEGDERAAPVIIARLNNEIDSFPTTVAGMDPSTNTFSFRRTVEPQVYESAQGFMFRQSTAGANFTIDLTGNIFLANGDKSVLLLNSDVVKIGIGSDTASLAMDPTTGQTTLKGTSVLLQSAGFAPVYHVMTTEALINVLSCVLAAFPAGPIGISGVFLAPPSPPSPVAIATNQTAIASLLATTCVLPTSGFLLPTTLAAIAGAFALQTLPPYLLAEIGVQSTVPPLFPASFPGIGRATVLAG